MEPLGDPRRQPRFELHVIPCSVAVDEAEAGLAIALVVTVGGTRLTLSLAHVGHHMGQFYQVKDHEVLIWHYKVEDFLMVFLDHNVADQVLHDAPPSGAGVTLVFHR
jgi:hypothetical protein